jgi:hypothetical protein
MTPVANSPLIQKDHVIISRGFVKNYSRLVFTKLLMAICKLMRLYFESDSDI